MVSSDNDETIGLCYGDKKIIFEIKNLTKIFKYKL